MPKRYHFPQGFLWGAASSAYQVEGAVSEEGRGESIWDRWCKTPGAVRNGHTGSEACRHYHMYREDVALMQRIGISAYRFSIGWPRVIPGGSGPSNPKGLDFYDRLVDELMTAGITPFVTLYHGDLPQKLEDAGGWTVRTTAYAFADYAATVVRKLSDRVLMWATFNEPSTTALGYETGTLAPGRTESRAVVNQVVHHLLLAHGLGVQAVRANATSDQKVGIVVNPNAWWPATDSIDDLALCERLWRTRNGLWLQPILRKGYPQETMDEFGDDAPDPEPGDMDIIAAKTDFIGLNYYTRSRVTIDKSNPQGWRREPIAPHEFCTDMAGSEVFAAGMENFLVEFSRFFGKVPIYISENGCSITNDHPNAQNRIADIDRIDFIRNHLVYAHRVLQQGIDLRGYFTWSLMDDFEWDWGYLRRFGLVHVDFKTFKRTIKDSGIWYGQVARRNWFESDILPVVDNPFMRH